MSLFKYTQELAKVKILYFYYQTYTGSEDFRGILDKEIISIRLARLISKEALKEGSSKHGKTLLA